VSSSSMETAVGPRCASVNGKRRKRGSPWDAHDEVIAAHGSGESIFGWVDMMVALKTQ
jgi:hypothetical protein